MHDTFVRSKKSKECLIRYSKNNIQLGYNYPAFAVELKSKQNGKRMLGFAQDLVENHKASWCQEFDSLVLVSSWAVSPLTVTTLIR